MAQLLFSLLDRNGGPWNGSGSYYLYIALDDGSEYLYTNGKTFAELGLVASSSDAEFEAKTPKYSIASTSSTIDFREFRDFGAFFGAVPANNDPKTIIIIGLNGKTGDAKIFVVDNASQNGMEAEAIGTISDNSVAFSLASYGSPWKRMGRFVLEAVFLDDGSFYLYTNGKTFAELGINANSSAGEIINKLPRYCYNHNVND